MKYYLTGNFNGWKPDDPSYRFSELTDPYGGPRPQSRLTLGSFTLETHLPPGRIQFKIVESGAWEYQWSVWPCYDHPRPITEHRFQMRNGLQPCLVFRRQESYGQIPHAEFDYPGGRMRWDFHPDSGTVTIHDQYTRSPGLRVGGWKAFELGCGYSFRTWYCLPFGFDPNDGFRYPVCLLFDGRNMLYGEEFSPWHTEWNCPNRQWVRALDTLARHGLIAPTVVIAVGVPRRQGVFYRTEAYLRHDSSLHRAFIGTICDRLLPEASATFHLADQRASRFAAGHSNGGDMALSLVVERPQVFTGAVAVSPGAPQRCSQLARLDDGMKQGLRVAIGYTTNEPTPGFVRAAAAARRLLLKSRIPHLVHYLPSSSHNAGSVAPYLPGLFSFVMG